MKNNGKVCDVRSLTVHWNISEMVYSTKGVKTKKHYDIKMTNKERVHASITEKHYSCRKWCINNNVVAEWIWCCKNDLTKYCDTQIIEVLHPEYEIPDDRPTVQSTDDSFS